MKFSQVILHFITHCFLITIYRDFTQKKLVVVTAFNQPDTIMNSDKETKLAIAMAVICYSFADTNWLWEALQAAGSPIQVIGVRSVREGNKILALYGDRLLGQFVAHEGIVQNTMNRSRQDPFHFRSCQAILTNL